MMTVRELIQQLSELDPPGPDPGYRHQSGFAPCTLNVVEVQELARGEGQEYLGRFELTEEAQRQAVEDLPPGRPWSASRG